MQRDAIEQITDRQREVARLVAEGRSNPEIAEALGISLAGAKYHVSELLGRLGVQRREDVAAWYRQNVGPVAVVRRRWGRLRARWPLGAVLGLAVPVAAVAIALGGGRAETPPTTATATATATALAVVTEVPEATPQPEVTPTAAVTTPGERIPLFYEYEVQAGDTLDGIAARFAVQRDHIIWNNIEVGSDADLRPGLLLQVPPVPGIIASVRPGDTVTSIAGRFDADWRALLEFEANGLDGDPNRLRPGMLVLVPGGRKVPLQAAPPSRPGAGSIVASGWIWPVEGSILNAWGPNHPQGIDLATEWGTTVVASRAGTVTYASGNPCCDYGYHVIVDHGDGYETLYAHLNDFAVALGAFVDAGDTIGWVGMTGRTPEPHLHFEVRREGVFQDPLQYLP